MSHQRDVMGSQATRLTGQPVKLVSVRLVCAKSSLETDAAELESSRDLPIGPVRPKLSDHIQRPHALLQASQRQPARRQLAAANEQGFWERATHEQDPAGPLLFRDACDSKPWTADKLVVGGFLQGANFPKNEVSNAWNFCWLQTIYMTRLSQLLGLQWPELSMTRPGCTSWNPSVSSIWCTRTLTLRHLGTSNRMPTRLVHIFCSFSIFITACHRSVCLTLAKPYAVLTRAVLRASEAA